ncbi:MAG: molecular chaperone TorD family protein [Geminicoccaceae bacterium]
MSAPLLNPPPGDSAERAAAKETIWRLAALAFSHPTAEMHAAFASGDFHRAFDHAWSGITGRHRPTARPSSDFKDFEAGYITAFLHGPKGKPIASLLAGDHERLLAGHARPVFMLNITAFYRHFGLKAATEDEGRTDEPDHLASMLEFMAVLSHLEANALGQGKDPSSYRRAERDFLYRYLAPMLRTVGACLRSGLVKDLDLTITQLAEELPVWADGQVGELEARVGPYRDPDASGGLARPQNGQVAAGDRVVDQNLWG